MTNITTNMVKGTEFKIKWEFRNDDDTPKDLTGYSVLVQIREYKWSEDYIVQYDENSSQITYDDAGGIVELEIPPTETDDFSFCSAYIDCLVYTTTDGDRSPSVEIVFDTGVSNIEV